MQISNEQKETHCWTIHIGELIIIPFIFLTWFLQQGDFRLNFFVLEYLLVILWICFTPRLPEENQIEYKSKDEYYFYFIFWICLLMMCYIVVLSIINHFLTNELSILLPFLFSIFGSLVGIMYYLILWGIIFEPSPYLKDVTE